MILHLQKKHYILLFLDNQEKDLMQATDLNYNASNTSLFVNATKVHQFKAKVSEIKDYALCLSNVTKCFTINNRKKAQSLRVVKFFFC